MKKDNYETLWLPMTDNPWIENQRVYWPGWVWKPTCGAWQCMFWTTCGTGYGGGNCPFSIISNLKKTEKNRCFNSVTVPHSTLAKQLSIKCDLIINCVIMRTDHLKAESWSASLSTFYLPGVQVLSNRWVKGICGLEKIRASVSNISKQTF